MRIMNIQVATFVIKQACWSVTVNRRQTKFANKSTFRNIRRWIRVYSPGQRRIHSNHLNR